MKREGHNLLISIDFRPDKGGIARLAHLIYQSYNFSKVLSLHGNTRNRPSVFYFNKNRVLLMFKAFQCIVHEKPQVLVFDHLNIARLLVFIPKILLKKVIIFLHDEEAWIRVIGFHRIALIRATHLICNSEHTMKKFLQHNPEFSGKTYVCLPGGVPEAFSELQEVEAGEQLQWFKDSRPYVVFVSRLWKAHRFKGYFELLQAFKEHYESSSNAHLRLAIIGNGNDVEHIQKFIDTNNLSLHISLFANVDDVSLGQFYKKSLALFFPSIREGFGMVYLEAMFFEKACIGIKGQPAEEIILDGETGRLLADNRSETLKKVLEDIELDQFKYQKFGKEGYKRYLDNFTSAHFKIRFLNSINQ